MRKEEKMKIEERRELSFTLKRGPSTDAGDASFAAGCECDVGEVGGKDCLWLVGCDLLDFLGFLASCVGRTFLFESPPFELAAAAAGPKLVVHASMSSSLRTCAVALSSS
nr:hypothetical protein Iba_scaffold262CG0200 [Ipomoea batatas]GME17235.1 hypothetical protein Iba_scaffold18403CG0990 [Ipomoea batatas]GME20464.1 hypothetical protein Iba_scaffold25184CG0010 [Ipomoea batatas]